MPFNLSRKTKVYTSVVTVGMIAVLILNPFHTVQSGYVGVLTDFGSVQDAPLEPGLHFAMPFYQRILSVSTQPQTNTSDETAATHDLQNVHTSVSVTFHIAPASAPGFYRDFRDFGTLGARIIVPTVSNDVKAITSSYNAEELITRRDEVDSKIRELVIKSLLPYHLTIEAVNIANFAFSEVYVQAIEAKQVAQQQALQAKYTLEQAEISSQEQVVKAKAAADAAVAQAQGEGQSLKITSQAQAEANVRLTASLSPQILQKAAIDKWDGTMPQYLSNGTPLPFIGSASQAVRP
ncbi:MAG: prohibitin family protein [Acetobacter aceti]|nr:prohibitin family protein [Acetobacter aceti]